MENEQKSLTPIRCPICGNLELAYVTEYHKCIGARIGMALFAALTIVCLVLGFTNPQMAQATTIFALILIALTAFLYICVLINESRTGVKAICPKCGHKWNI